MPASTTPNIDAPDNYQTTYDSKTKIVVFYSLIMARILKSGLNQDFKLVSTVQTRLSPGLQLIRFREYWHMQSVLKTSEKTIEHCKGGA